MSERFFVTGTGTDVGKTVISAALAQGLCALDLEVTYWKPIQAGHPMDSETVKQIVTEPGLTVCPSMRTYPLAASPDQAAGAIGLREEFILRELEQQYYKLPGFLGIIEGAGGILVPLNSKGQTWRHWLVKMRSKPRVLVVAHSGLGTINHTCLTIEALQKKNMFISGVILNGPEHPGNIASLERALPGIPIRSFPLMEGLNQNPLWLPACTELAQFVLKKGIRKPTPTLFFKFPTYWKPPNVVRIEYAAELAALNLPPDDQEP